ncbi:MAG: hypothetical protein QM696_04540 [Steroidobacteraceae bacterium]
MNAFRSPVIGLVLAAVVMLPGCRVLGSSNTCNKPQEYQQAQDLPALHVPLGLDAPDTRAALRIPPLDQPPVAPRSEKDPCLDEPPAYASTPAAPAGPVPAPAGAPPAPGRPPGG